MDEFCVLPMLAKGDGCVCQTLVMDVVVLLSWSFRVKLGNRVELCPCLN
jgi:hypothetical protein